MTIAGPTTAPSGSIVSYVLTATNLGPEANPATGLQFELPIPTGLGDIAAPAGCTLGAGVYTCVIAGPVAQGASVDLTFTGQITVGATSFVTPVGNVSGSAPVDPIVDNNSTSLTNPGFSTEVTAGSDVAISKTRSPGGTILDGEQVTFTLTASYSGGTPAGLVITDVIPSEYGNYSLPGDLVVPAGWDCSASVGQTISCSNPTPFGSAGLDQPLGSVMLTVEADLPSPVTTTVTNTATISATTPDPIPANNTDTDGGVTIAPPFVDLSANKSGPVPALVVEGNSYTFPISTTNVGNAGYVGTVQMVDVIPNGMVFTGISAPGGWVCTPPPTFVGDGSAAVTCELVYTSGAPLGVNATTPVVVVTLQAPVPTTNGATFVNSMTVNSIDVPVGELDETNLANNTTDVSVTGTAGGQQAGIAILKSVVAPVTLPDDIFVGEVRTFTLEITNDGPQPSLDIEVLDLFGALINSATTGANPGFVGFSLAPGVATFAGTPCTTASAGSNGVQLECQIDTLPVCVAGSNCPVITVQVRPGGNDTGLRTNTTSAISQTTGDDDLDDNTDTATFEVENRTDVQVTKTATPSTVPSGQNLTYLIAARNPNTGLSTAANVVITDVLPDDLTFVSISATGGGVCTSPVLNTTTTTGNNTVECTWANINNNSQRTVTIIVRPNSELAPPLGTNPLTNDVSIATDTPETDETNNDATVDVTVEPPLFDLLINKIESIDPVAVDQDTIYTLMISNLGPSAVQDLVVTDIMPPARLSFQSVSIPTGETCSSTPATGAVGANQTCEFPYIPAGQSRDILITARGVLKGVATNTVTMTSDDITAGFDTNTGNNSTTQPTTVRTRADVEVFSKTPDANPVNLNDDFNFLVVVRNNALTGPPPTSEADNVVVSDTLPAGMVLTAVPSVAINTGTATLSTCTGTIGATSFTCDLGTFSSGGQVTITVPVEVVTTTSQDQVFTNAATVSTSSLDANPNNNTNSGDVTVGSSSIAGTVYRDFDGDEDIDAPEDTGIGGVVLTLTGFTHDGVPITRTVTTSTVPGFEGTYTFANLPASNVAGYTITRDPVSEAHLDDASSEVGSTGGTETSPTVISAIPLGAADEETGYEFSLTPIARVGIAKAASAPVINADGTFTVDFSLLVENFSLEPLINMVVTDPLTGALPLFGTYEALGTPATDPFGGTGRYTILTPPGGSCGGLQAGFDGNGGAGDTLATGFGMAATSTCTITFSLRVAPADPTDAYENQALVDGEGALTGQTSGTNPELTDLSNNGAEPDPNNSGTATEGGEDVPTPVAPAFTPGLTLLKTADLTAAATAALADGDTFVYRFRVENTGNVALNVTVLDTSLTFEAAPPSTVDGTTFVTLQPGDVDDTTFQATYMVTLANINDGFIENNALATGTDPFGDDVTDPSNTLTQPITQQPSIALVKTVDDSQVQSPAVVGDIITYSFVVTNTGNVTLTNVDINDPLLGGDVPNGPITMLPGAINSTEWALVDYVITQDDIDLGHVENTAVATGTPPPSVGGTVSDDSGTANDNDTPTDVSLGQNPQITLIKTANTEGLQMPPQPLDEITYTFTIENTGNVTLNNVTVTDTFLPGIVVVGSPLPLDNFEPDEIDTGTWEATYAISAADIANGQVDNQATVTGDYVDETGNPLSTDAMDDETAIVVSIEANTETAPVFPPFTGDGGTTPFDILDSDLMNGDPAILYVSGTPGFNDVTINPAYIASDPAVTLDPTTGLITLAPGSPAGEYTIEYQICSAQFPTICDTAIETVVQAPITRLEVVKTQEFVDDGDGEDGVGDTLIYTVTVESFSNVPVENVTLVDTLQGLDGRPLVTLPLTFQSTAPSGNAAGTLDPGDIATYTASYLLTIDAVSGGGTSNSVVATGDPIFPATESTDPTPVSDTSDDDNDGDGNTEDDPTDYPIAPLVMSGDLTITKTTPVGVVLRGSTVPYTIMVENVDVTVAGPLNIVDALPAGFLYVVDSATLEGVPAVVEVSGNTVTWPLIDIPPLTIFTFTIEALVTNGASAGEHTNAASVRDPVTDELLAPIARATVRILPEPVFDCGDVIGKVFDDENRDGYQNATEIGIPAARVAGVDGTIITTDEHGRFHVPCAMLPAKRGSNFILKLDTRSLPTGYRITTENPRVVRLTPGKMTELNFGAAVTKVVRLDININAFVAGENNRAELSPALQAGIAKLLPRIVDNGTNLRISFHMPADADKDDVRRARALMELVEDHVRDEWFDVGRVKLTVEHALVRASQ